LCSDCSGDLSEPTEEDELWAKGIDLR